MKTFNMKLPYSGTIIEGNLRHIFWNIKISVHR